MPVDSIRKSLGRVCHKKEEEKEEIFSCSSSSTVAKYQNENSEQNRDRDLPIIYDCQSNSIFKSHQLIEKEEGHIADLDNSAYITRQTIKVPLGSDQCRYVKSRPYAAIMFLSLFLLSTAAQAQIETDFDNSSSSMNKLSDFQSLLNDSKTASQNAKIALPAGVSMSRNSLIRGDNNNILQRQLREKAKQDSLESIKMHILMRLNLKQLPNITKPIPVPQNILENFYKNYNASKSVSDDAKAPRTDEFIENLSAEMQSDDANANAFDDVKWIYNVGRDDKSDNDTNFNDKYNRPNDEDYESILSHINSIYVFPEQPHVRHNRKQDLLRFNFDSSYSDISYATLHLYLRGWNWIKAHLPELTDEMAVANNQDIVVAIHRAVRRANSTGVSHTAKLLEFRRKIPNGDGQWIKVDLKTLFGGHNNTQELLIRGVEPWMRPLIVTMDNAAKNPLTVHIEIGSEKKHRRKRSVYMDCTESDHDMRCCRYPLKVNFTAFGWNFVVAPTSFDAYFCSGDCQVGFLEHYTHTHLASLTTSASPCCSPTKMSSLSLLYFDYNHNLVLSVIPNMSVEGCSCS